jgi:hypothetical protein
MGLSGCGSRDSGFLASQPKNYTITVTGTSGSWIYLPSGQEIEADAVLGPTPRSRRNPPDRADLV